MVPKHILIAGCCSVLLTVPALAQSTKLSPRDKEFLKMAAVSNMTEAHLGEMAEGKAAKTGIKDYGQMLAKDHTKAYEELTVLDSKLGQSIPEGHQCAPRQGGGKAGGSQGQALRWPVPAGRGPGSRTNAGGVQARSATRSGSGRESICQPSPAHHGGTPPRGREVVEASRLSGVPIISG